MSNTPPYSWGEARDAINAAKAAHKTAVDGVSEAFTKWAAAEKAYRLALAQNITDLRAAGNAATLCADLARGDSQVAHLRYLRDVAEGVKEAAIGSQWKFTADRRELEQLVEWSFRRDMAEGNGMSELEPSGRALRGVS